jgi:hypothetical protein
MMMGTTKEEKELIDSGYGLFDSSIEPHALKEVYL